MNGLWEDCLPEAVEYFPLLVHTDLYTVIVLPLSSGTQPDTSKMTCLYFILMHVLHNFHFFPFN